MLVPGAMVLAQSGPNLISNPGFESFSKPVSTWDQLERCMGWTNATKGTVDVFNTGASYVGVPENDLGSSTAFDGEHYAGFVAYKDDQRTNWKHIMDPTLDATLPAYQQYTEYLQTPLSTPLVAGQQYDITFRVKLSGNSDRAVSGIGGYCSPT
ncbi:MAG: hypothetical protein H6597_06140, partial [Flavobacteriales bacterium]|nr:hypothetical protein [Flavobacteriales bacterium]